VLKWVAHSTSASRPRPAAFEYICSLHLDEILVTIHRAHSSACGDALVEARNVLDRALLASCGTHRPPLVGRQVAYHRAEFPVRLSWNGVHFL
jgi:hypothetical protein